MSSELFIFSNYKWLNTNRLRNFSLNSDGVGSGASLVRSGAEMDVLGKGPDEGPLTILSLNGDRVEVDGPSMYLCCMDIS